MCAGFINQQQPAVRNVFRIPEGFLNPPEQEDVAEQPDPEYFFIPSKADEAMAIAMVTVVHPITVVRALIQFGYEPFPTSSGRKYGIFGNKVLFFPNIFSYTWHLAKSRRISTIFEGLDSAVFIYILSGTVEEYTWNLLGRKSKWLAGSGDEEKESLSSQLKFAMRLTLTDIAVKVATRPIKVVLFRQIATIVGRETTFSTLSGLENGVRNANLFDGLGTELRNVLLGSFLAFATRCVFSRFVKRKQTPSSDSLLEILYETMFSLNAKFFQLSLSVLFQCTVGCPLEVTSKIRAIVGSGLSASRNLPEQCATSRGAWLFLSDRSALRNAFTWFFRIKPDGPRLLPEYEY